MQMIQVYKCLCDVQRLRILNLLREGPLCVCHLAGILQSDQVKVSKQLRYMKELGMVQAKREAQWMIYRLASNPHTLLTENLRCLQDLAGELPEIRQDLRKRERIIREIKRTGSACPGVVISGSADGCDAKSCS